MRAFTAAKSLKPDKNLNDDIDKDEYVTKAEFKPLL